MKHGNSGLSMKGVSGLLLALLFAAVARGAFAVDLISNLIRCSSGMTPYVVLNGEERTSGKFYGYVNGGTGPGDSAFRDAKAWADAHNTPLVVVFDNGSGNTFTADLNDDEDYQGGRYLLQWMNGKAGPDNYNCMFTYFKGGTTAPAACKDAYDFCKQYGAGTLFPLVVCYWKWHDGTIRTSVTSGLSSVGSFKGPVDSFISKNRPPPYTPPKCSIDFAVKDGELKMTPETAQVYVPFVRTNSTDAVGSKYGLEVTYPDTTTTNITFTAGTIGEIKLEEVATAGKWADGKSIQLVLFNTNQVAVATNHIMCVAAPANSVGFPYLPGKTDSLEVGDWSMDVGFISASGTNVAALRAVVAGATKEYASATNALATAEATSNTTYGVYIAASNALEAAIIAYDDATNYLYYAESTNATATAAYIDATNALAEAVAAYDLATNALYYAGVTNATATAAYEAATTALAGAQTGFLDASNTLYYAESTNATATAAYEAAMAALSDAQDEYVAASNELANAESGTPAYQAAEQRYINATNALYYAESTNATATAAYEAATTALAGAQSGFLDASNTLYYAESTNATATAAYIDATNALAGAQSGFLDASNTLYYAESTNATATTAYIDATNALAGAIVAYDDAMNYLYYAGVTNEVAAATYAGAVKDLDEKQSTAETKTGELEDAAAACEAAEADFFVVFSGSVVANDEMGDVAAFLGSNEYREWVLSNKVRNIVLDCPEDAESWKGASLFSYATAANGKSGAYFISINGLSPAEAQDYSEELKFAFMMYRDDWDTPGAPEVLLVRADGTEAGTLSLYRDGSGYDVKENIARLKELVANAADKTEAMNDYLIGEDLPVFAFGGETNGVGSLSVNDTIDWFQVTGLQAKKAITFDITKDPNAPSISFVLATGDGAEIPMSVTNVWVLTDEQIASDVYVGVGAYADAASAATKFNGKSLFSYTVSAKAAPENPGKIGFTATNDTVTEGQWEDGKPGKPGTSTEYVFKVARTEGLNGHVQAKVSLDMSEEEYAAIHGRFEWTDQVLAWDDLEAGEKDVVITLKNDDACYDASNIVFKVEITGGSATVEDGNGKFTLTLEEEDPATYGSLEISNVLLPVAGDGRMYVRSSEAVELTVSRAGGSNGSARGTVIAKLAGKSFETNEYEWAAMETGIKTNMFEIPALTAAKTEVLFSLTSSIGKGRDSVKVYALASDAPEFEAKAVDWTGIQYTTTETNLVALSAFTGMTLKGLNKISGTIPAGLKVAIVDGELVVTGTPTAGVETTATFWVALTRDGGGTLYSLPVTVTFRSEALADVNPGFTSARSWTGLPVMNLAGDHLAGLLDMSVAKNGKTSARYRLAGGQTVSFSSPGLAGIDDECNVALYAAKTVKSNGVAKKYELFATLGSNGSLAATIACNGVDIGEMSIPAGTVPWSADRTAQAFGGNYVAAFPLANPDNTHSNTLCFGATSMRFKCNTESAWKAGKVTFAGTLPNGKAVSGTATFAPTTNNATSAMLPVFASSSADTFSAMVGLDGVQLAATEGVVPFWKHDEGGIKSLSYENDYDVIGALWSWADWNWSGEKVNVNRTSGIVSGTMRLKLDENSDRLTTVTWRGVAIPGDEPLVLGAYWCNASMQYGDNRRRTVRVGDVVELQDAE